MTTDEKWKAYYKKHLNRPPMPLFKRAVALADLTGEKLPRVAVDYGCGAGVETLAMLERGFRVLAIDGVRAAIDSLDERVPIEYRANYTGLSSRFEELDQLIPNSFVYAYHSIPFCEPEYISQIWRTIEESIYPGGIFAGSFFGLNDDWVKSGKNTGVSGDQLTEFFQNFEVIEKIEVDKLGPTALDGEKHWHTYEIIARKR